MNLIPGKVLKYDRGNWAAEATVHLAPSAPTVIGVLYVAFVVLIPETNLSFFITETAFSANLSTAPLDSAASLSSV